MDDQKKTGSYYTPKILADFLILHIFDKYLNSGNIEILEPSCGDGQFIDSIFNTSQYEDFSQIKIDLVDINSAELEKIVYPDSPKIICEKINDDYLNFFLTNRKKYTLIVGNPPYIRKKNMLQEQILRCEEIHAQAKLYSSVITDTGRIKNIWPAFIEAAIMSLNTNGVICFVLPSEILQVKYSKELRDLIRTEFEKVEIFAFNELIFEGIEQDVIALIGIKKVENKEEHGVSFYQVDTLSDLKEPKFTEKFSNIHRHSLDKWTNYILSDEELNFVDSIKSSYQPLKKYCDKIEVGIVTAANEFFILNNKAVRENRLDEVDNLIKPIIPKGSALPNTINLTTSDLVSMAAEDKNVHFIHFPDLPKIELSEVENRYINKGEIEKGNDVPSINNRYKMKLRNNWYHIPSVWHSEVLFVKRCHEYPRVLINSANAYATDSFYRVVISKKFSSQSLVFSFFNSLTFILAELEGRYYGGGVLELIPTEFKELIIPYKENIGEVQFSKLDAMFRRDESIDRILDFTDNLLLSHLGLDSINQLRSLRKKLLNRRLKGRFIDNKTT